MSFELGWNILPIIVTLLAFGFAVIVHGIALVLASEISGPFRDVTSFFSDAGIVFALVLYLVAGGGICNCMGNILFCHVIDRRSVAG